jgi:beta-galactosidase/beta-glucuronidase
MADEIEIIVTDVNDIEAHIVARYGDGGGVVLTGTVRGPYCATAHTLPAEYSFRPVSGSKPATAEAIVPDPCTWSQEAPHLYEVNVMARRGADVVAGYRGSIGLRGRAEQTE